MAKILIAEDDGKLLEVFSTAIESEGFCVIKAVNGRIAWDILNANPDISLLICDMSMPEMDGKAVIENLKANSRLCSMPILAVSRVLRIREITSLLDHGVSHFMAKPVNLQELVGVVKRLLKER